MRSNLSPNDQLLMCMSKIQPGDHYSTATPTIVKNEQYSISSSESSRTSCDDYETIAFGPIKVKPRKKPAPTLATGRRSKYEILTPDEEQKRNIRRARNRAAAERVRISRLNIEQQLLNQIESLEKQEEKLMNNIEILQHKKLHLETRLFTHEQMCSTMNSTQVDLTNFLQMETDPTTFQTFDTAINGKLPELDFDDLFLNSLTNEQVQHNFSEPFPTIALNDDLNFLMDP